MTYEEKIEKLFSRTPSFQQVGAAAYKPGLDTMVAFDALLGHPAQGLRCIHIAGTNGKGSVSSFLAAALSEGMAGTEAGKSGKADEVRHTSEHTGSQAKSPVQTDSGTHIGGRRIGLYTSPHLTDFRERIKIVLEDGFEMIPREAVEEFLDRYDDFIETHRPSFFEITTAMAFWYFATAGVDMAVIECGLGGRLDSTNIITPLVSVITNIGLEHCTLLGDTLEQIAFEKAGIIKSGVPVVVGEINPYTRPVFEKVAAERGCEMVFAPERPCDLPAEGARSLAEQSDDTDANAAFATMDLPGEYQRQNLATVAAALDILSSHYGIEADTSRLERAASLTGLHGRWEKLAEKPDIICDIGHNAHGLRRVFEQLRKVAPNYRHVYIIFGVVSDKDVEAIAPLMIQPNRLNDTAQSGSSPACGPSSAEADSNVSYILTQPSTQRAMPVACLAATLERHGITGITTSTVTEAVALAKKEAAANDLIFIGGSNFTVSDAVAAIVPSL